MTDQIVRLGPEYFPRATSGVPISGGSIYIGEPDLDPEIPANQIQVSALQENGTTVPIPQPILTGGGGVPLYNGAPVTLLVSESYSLKVLDAFSVQIYYVPSIVVDKSGVESVSSLLELILITTPVDNQTTQVLSFYNGLNKGGGQFYWDSSTDKATADGGTIVDPDNTGGFDGTTLTVGSYLATQGTGVGAGCWVRVWDDALNITWFGTLGDGLFDNAIPLNSAMTASSGQTLLFPDGDYNISTFIDMPTIGVRVIGTGRIFGVTLFGEPIKGHRIFNCETCSGFSFEGVTIETSTMTSATNGTRGINIDLCSDYFIDKCVFKVNGAAVASTGCSNYSITNNDIEVSSFDSVTKHDGVIDQWAGSHDFNVSGNRVNGGGIARYAILVTGTDSFHVAAGCSNFTITDNVLYNCLSVGIWVNGRDGINTDFVVHGNVITDIIDFHGISLSDVIDFAVTGNVITRVGSLGIQCYKETSGNGVTGAQNGTITGNTITDANELVSALSLSGSSIVVRDDPSKNVNVNGNVCTGANHIYGVLFYIGISYCAEGGNIIEGATIAPATDVSATKTNKISYTELKTLAATPLANITTITGTFYYTYSGNVVTIHFFINLTATAAGLCSAEMEQPILSGFTSNTEVTGMLGEAFGSSGVFESIAAGDKIKISFNALAAILYPLRGQCSYIVK